MTEEVKKGLTILILTGDNSFFRTISKMISGYAKGIEVIQTAYLKHTTEFSSSNPFVIVDEDYITKNYHKNIYETISALVRLNLQVLLLSSFKTDICKALQDLNDQILIASKHLKKEELTHRLTELQLRQKKLGKSFERLQDKYLEAIIKIQNTLLSGQKKESKMLSILELIGNTTGACKVGFFENKFDYHGRLLMSETHFWERDQASSGQSNPIFNLLPYEPNYARWEKELSSGNHIVGSIDDFPNSERPLLKTHGIQKLLLIPILIKNDFWGFVMFTVCPDREVWSENEIALIKSSFVPIAAFIEIKTEERKRDISDERLRRIFENSNIGLVLASKEGVLKYFNPAFSALLGYADAEIKNLNFRAFTHPDDLQKELSLLEELINGKISSYLIEKRFIKKGGSVVWVKLNISAYSKEKGKPESLIGIVENITKQIETEKALTESEDRYRKLSDLSLEGILLHKKGIAIDCNERFPAMLGYERHELIGMSLSKMLADEGSADLTSEKIKNNEPDSYEAVGITKSGKKIPVELENRQVVYNGDRLQVIAFRDITERKRNEQEIRKLNTAVDQSPSSILITDRKGKIEYVNKSFCEVTGYTLKEAKGKNPRILKTDYHSKEFYKSMWNEILKGNTWRGEFRNKTKSGNYYWEKAVISPIFDEHNNITHYLAIKENITQEKAAQEALKISEERHRIISELTNDFVYSAVIQSVKMKSEWTSGTLEKLTAYTISEIDTMERGWYSCIVQEDYNQIILPALKVLPVKKSLNIEYRILAKGGEERWVSDKVKLIKEDKEAGIYYVIGAIQDITKRKHALLELDESKRYLDSIIDNLPIGLQIFDEKGFTARINEKQRKLIGIRDLTAAEVEFNILTDPLSLRTGADKIFKKVYEKKITVNHDLEFDLSMGNQRETKEGVVTLNQIIFPILKKNGEIHSVISLTSDISKRVEAEIALKNSERHQKALLQIIPDLIFVFTEEGVFKDVYTEDSSRLLMPSEHFLGKQFSDIFPGALSDLFYSHLESAVETGEIQSYTYALNDKEKVFNYEVRMRLSKENEVIAIIRDITDNVIAENALKESEEKFRELAERTQDALVLINAQNKVLYASPNLKRILGITPEFYSKYPLKALKLIHPGDKSYVIPELNNYRKGKQESLDLQFRVILKSGQMKWIWYRENTVFDNNNNPVRYAAVITDITANKITEEELKLAKEEAENANRSKSAFLANISHEIRTPMNAVLGFSDLLHSRIQDPVLKGYLNSIKSGGKTLLNLLNDILDLSKIEADKMSIIRSPVNLHEVIDEIKHIFSLKALEKGLDYSFTIDKKIPSSLMLDELRLKQILLNLIDNAIKFTEKGMIKVEVNCIGVQNTSDRVDISISVEDTGIGIPQHLQESIFESFRQQDDQDKKKYQGTGLGLAITKRLVELFPGEIKLKSRINKGSTFEVILKKIKVSKLHEITQKTGGSKIKFAQKVLNDKMIVLLDEEKSNRDLIKEVFNQSGSIVKEGENLKSILPALVGEEDLIIMELKSTGNIHEELRFLNDYPKLKLIPKIGITSSADYEIPEGYEFRHILTKPINLRELVNIVGLMVKHQSVEDVQSTDDERKEKISKEVSDKVVPLLEGEQYKIWESSLKTSSFSEIEKFAHNIKNIGLEYNLASLQSFSDVLVMHAKNFDIDNMNDVLKSYPEIVRELKNSK